jgi:hypothetical protein
MRPIEQDLLPKQRKQSLRVIVELLGECSNHLISSPCFATSLNVSFSFFMSED